MIRHRHDAVGATVDAATRGAETAKLVEHELRPAIEVEARRNVFG